MRFLALLLGFSMSVYGADRFSSEAVELALRLKTSLMTELQQKIAKSGHVEAIEFCQLNVRPIAKIAAGDLFRRYRFGRTSYKVRSAANMPEDWVVPYLEEFKDLRQNDTKAAGRVHTFSSGKRAYLEPLFVQPMCLSCHGSAIGSQLKAAISARYPSDQATGFRLGDFRGFIWIREN